uniref:Uncharacterized protein n=1 Tax=Arundo donax TaxID=35708 RepID=A0A0A9AYV0_ARUDO
MSFQRNKERSIHARMGLRPAPPGRGRNGGGGGTSRRRRKCGGSPPDAGRPE